MKAIETVDLYLNYIDGDFISTSLTESEIQSINEIVATDKLVKAYDKAQDIFEKVLKKFKIPLSAIRASAKKLASKFKGKMEAGFKSGKDPQQFARSLQGDFRKAIVDEIQKAKKRFDNADVIEKVGLAVLLTVVVVFINSFLLMLFKYWFHIKVAMYIGMTVGAPLAEEALKNISIQLGMPWLGALTFAGIEMGMHVKNLLAAGYSIPVAIIARLVTVGFHMFTAYMQKKVIERGEGEGTNTAFQAWMVGVALHVIWNGVVGIGLFMGGEVNV
jgi:hypothetical protein